MTFKTKIMIILTGLAALILAVVAWSILQPSSGNRLTAGFNAEFITRPDGFPGLTEAYNFEFAQAPKQMDTGLMYKACSEGAVDVICAFATDGRIEAYGLVTLEDDKNFFPPYHAAPLMRQDLVEQHPEVKEQLSLLAGQISNDEMREMNYQADRDVKPLEPANIARAFLVYKGLLEVDATAGSGEAGTIAIGGKDFTEQQILGEIMSILLEHQTDLAVQRNLYLGGTMICFNALRNGDLATYAEYTGTGLVNILKRDVISDPDQAYETVAKAFREEYDLVWGKPFGFNNTYTLTMRKEQADRLGIKTISDLANHIRAQNPK